MMFGRAGPHPNLISCLAAPARMAHSSVTTRLARGAAILKGIDPRLNADVLGCLRAMGHGDTLVVADTNFPADTVGRKTVIGAPLQMENLTAAEAAAAEAAAAEAAAAILSVFPLDTFVDDFAMRMQVVGAPDEIPDVQKEVQAEIDRAEGTERPMIGVERFAFYDLASQSYAVIQTGERRFYGCFVLRKGVVGPDD